MTPVPALLRVLAAVLAGVALAPAPAGAAATWLGAVDLSAASANGTSPHLAADARGDAVAVWNGEAGEDRAVHAAFRPAGGTWQAPVAISAVSRSEPFPRVAIDPQGSAVAVWTRRARDGADSIVQAAVRPANGRWSKPVNLSAAGHGAYNPDVAVDPQGNAVAIWQRFKSANAIAVQAATRPAGGSWQPPVNVSAPGRDSSVAPHVALGANGDAVAVWRDRTTSGVRGAARPAGGPWQAPTDIAAPGPSDPIAVLGVFPRVAVDARGNAVAVWHHPTASDSIARAAVRPAGGAWQAPVTLSAPGGDATAVDVAVDPAGNAVAVWDRATDTGPHAVQAAVRAAGAPWQAPVDLSTGSLNSTDPHVAMDAQGTAAAVWTLDHLSDARDAVQVASRATGAAWQGSVTVAAAGTGEGVLLAEVALDARGGAVALWEQTTTSRSVVEGPGGFVVRSADFGLPAGRPAATVTRLRLSPRAFRAGRSVRPARPRASFVSYALDVAASVRFTVQRVRAGHNIRLPGSFTRRRPAGGDRFAFNGDVAGVGALLAPGRYRLVATPIAGGRRGTAVSAPFRINAARARTR